MSLILTANISFVLKSLELLILKMNSNVLIRKKSHMIVSQECISYIDEE